jgi:hypothetical protein
MEIEVRQRGGFLGLDRHYLVKDGAIEVTDKGLHRKSQSLDPEQVARIAELAKSASEATVDRTGADDTLASDEMETTLAIRHGDGDSNLQLRSGDKAPRAVWDLIGEVSKASGA